MSRPSTTSPSQGEGDVQDIGPRADRSTSISSAGSGTPRRRMYHIAPVSMGGPKRSPRSSVSESTSPPNSSTAAPDEIAAYMSQLAAREARVSELRESLKGIELELQAAEFDLAQFRKTGTKLAHTLRSTPPRSLARATTTDLERGIREQISRSPSPQRVPKESQVKRVVGEIGSQFWSFVEDVRTAALGEDDDESSDSDHDTNRRHRRSAVRSRDIRDPDPTQYM